MILISDPPNELNRTDASETNTQWRFIEENQLKKITKKKETSLQFYKLSVLKSV